MKVAVIVGHDKKSAGAYSKSLKISEYVYNSEVASELSCVADIYKRPNANGYKSQMQILANELNPKGYDLVVELHFNSFNEKANGTETVGFKGNNHTKYIGNSFNEKISKHYKTINRGHKTSDVGGRGYWFLKLMDAPALILEPFFGDASEALKFADTKEYACIIKQWLMDIK